MSACLPYQLLESHRCFDGSQKVYSHWSESTHCEMRFALYLPPAAEQDLVPLLYWLSGMSCTEQNFIIKAGAQRCAAELGVAIVVPDTSPRNFPGADEEPFKRGAGAGFYLDATEKPWVDHFQMYSYIQQELPALMTKHFPIDPARCSIFGHSMGGHGALVVGIRNPNMFRSLSVFAPLCSPMHTATEMLEGYLGKDRSSWELYDACHLIRERGWPHGEILFDQGTADHLLEERLKPELFAQACAEAKVPLQLRMQKNYQHNYYFISTFINDHLRFHAERLR